MIYNKYTNLFTKIKNTLIKRYHSSKKFQITPNDKFKFVTYLNENHIFRFSDKFYLKKLYKYSFNKKLDLENPKTFSEKLQWLKLYDRNPEYTKMVDKYEAKEYVSEKIGKEYIIPTYGVYNSFDDINFDSLPNQFVIKCTHTSGDIIICYDKKNFNINNARQLVNKNLKRDYYHHSLEWPYKNIKPRIIIEKYLGTKDQKKLINYKFFCFNGTPKFLQISEYISDKTTLRIKYMDLNYNEMDIKREDFPQTDIIPQKPKNFEKMKELASVLSKDIAFVRIDLYENDNKIYFGEFTFFPHSGFISFKPEKYDLIFGNMLNLPNKK